MQNVEKINLQQNREKINFLKKFDKNPKKYRTFVFLSILRSKNKNQLMNLHFQKINRLCEV